MESSDVKCLFTIVPLNKTIDIILQKVYDEKVNKTTIPKTIMKELLCLCTKLPSMIILYSMAKFISSVIA